MLKKIGKGVFNTIGAFFILVFGFLSMIWEFAITGVIIYVIWVNFLQ